MGGRPVVADSQFAATQRFPSPTSRSRPGRSHAGWGGKTLTYAPIVVCGSAGRVRSTADNAHTSSGVPLDRTPSGSETPPSSTSMAPTCRLLVDSNAAIRHVELGRKPMKLGRFRVSAGSPVNANSRGRLRGSCCWGGPARRRARSKVGRRSGAVPPGLRANRQARPAGGAGSVPATSTPVSG